MRYTTSISIFNIYIQQVRNHIHKDNFSCTQQFYSESFTYSIDILWPLTKLTMVIWSVHSQNFIILVLSKRLKIEYHIFTGQIFLNCIKLDLSHRLGSCPHKQSSIIFPSKYGSTSGGITLWICHTTFGCLCVNLIPWISSTVFGPNRDLFQKWIQLKGPMTFHNRASHETLKPGIWWKGYRFRTFWVLVITPIYCILQQRQEVTFLVGCDAKSQNVVNWTKQRRDKGYFSI